MSFASLISILDSEEHGFFTLPRRHNHWGGIVGLAVAYQTLERFPGSPVTVLEKEPQVGQHQSGHNSGVLHAGLYYKPGSLKARLATTGIRRMIEFCQTHCIPHEVCGKLVVATEAEELPRLDDLLSRGTANGLRGLRRLGPEEMREREPNIAGLAAIEVPEEGIADYPAVCRTLAQQIIARGGQVLTSSPALSLERHARLLANHHTRRELQSGFLFNCAGLHCDRVMALTGEQPKPISSRFAANTSSSAPGRITRTPPHLSRTRS